MAAERCKDYGQKINESDYHHGGDAKDDGHDNYLR
jgi:hypothetical protein